MNGMNIIGVQFRRAGKIYDFLAKDLLVQVGDHVVVDTDRGPSLAEVVNISFEAAKGSRDFAVMKHVVRLASGRDLDEAGRLNSEKAEDFTKNRIRVLGLDMRLIKADVQFGGSKVILFFSSPGRVDFRELVKDLAAGLKSRVELKQVGARDEAKLTGGLGICGREFCCSSFLREFVPVSIKMAKNQNLALNPAKISGGCGRLLCCLTYEDETYVSLKKNLLPRGTRVRLADGTVGDVLKGDILNQKVLIETETGEQRSVPISDCELIGERGRSDEEPTGDEWGDDLDIAGLMDKKGPARKDKAQGRRDRERGPGKPTSENGRQASHNESDLSEPLGPEAAPEQSGASDDEPSAEGEAGQQERSDQAPRNQSPGGEPRQDSGRRGRRRNRSRRGPAKPSN